MKPDLYQDAIVAQAKRASRAGRLETPDATITLDNPLCGDRVTIDVRLDDGRIVDLAQRVRGCLLCEASASVVGANAVGQTGNDIAAAQRDTRAMLEGGTASTARWPGLEAFTPVSSYKSRHACVLLPFEALLEAVKAAHGGSK